MSILFDQLLRSGTSIGANVEEAAGAYFTKRFPV
ncbi:MAG: four helix bundle protein [Chitinispirillaceae bacterium]